MSNPVAVCDFCGRPEAHQVADQFICDDCYIAKGSCCAGEDDEEDAEESMSSVDSQGLGCGAKSS